MATTTRQDTAIARREPFLDLTDFGTLASRLFGENWAPAMRGWAGEFVPGADLEETDEAFVLEIELPGVGKGDITIDVTGRRVRVHGERKARERAGVLRHTTRTSGRFDYEMVLPSMVDDSAITAKLTDGVLRISLPKAKAERSKHIAIS